MRFDRSNLARLLTAMIVFVAQTACACHAMAAAPAPVQPKSHSCCHKDSPTRPAPHQHQDGAACPHCDGSAAAMVKADQTSRHFPSLDFPAVPFFADVAPIDFERPAFVGVVDHSNLPPPPTLLALHCALIA